MLPTYGYARAYSGLSVLDFVKRITVQELSAEGLRTLGPTAVTLARLEGLDGHAAFGDAAAADSQRAASAERGHGLMSWLTQLARPDIVALAAYEHAAWRPELERLHANELPWRCSRRCRRSRDSTAIPSRSRASSSSGSHLCMASHPSGSWSRAAAMRRSTF